MNTCMDNEPQEDFSGRERKSMIRGTGPDVTCFYCGFTVWIHLLSLVLPLVLQNKQRLIQRQGNREEGWSTICLGTGNSDKHKILHIALLNRSCPGRALFMTLNVKTTVKSSVEATCLCSFSGGVGPVGETGVR